MTPAPHPAHRRPVVATPWDQPHRPNAYAGEAFDDDPAALIDATLGEADLAAQYAAVLAHLDFVTSTVAHADWPLAAERLGQLADAARNLQQQVGTVPTTDPPSALRELAIVVAQRSRAGRALHPIDTLTDRNVRAAADVQRRRTAALDADNA